MNTFINTKKDFSPTTNFWELNPHLMFVKPFSDLYNADKTKNHEQSSKDMWCILWMSDPDEDTNKYYRLPEDQRFETCKNFNKSFDKDDELTAQCLEAYPEVCLSTIERALRAEREAIAKRALFLQSAVYSYDTMTMLDNAFSKTSKILEQYGKIYEQFVQSKKKSVMILGQREQTAREKKRLRPDLAEEQ